MKISACWIVKNDEVNIVNSINSLKNAVDEIVVVDTGSTDNTVEACKNAGARVEYFEWINDFSAARNYALSQVSGDVTFFLDSDEWFTTTLTIDDRKRLEDIFIAEPNLETIQIIVDDVDEDGNIKLTHPNVKMIRLGAGLQYEGMIHEKVVNKDGKLSFVYVDEFWHLTHVGYIKAKENNKPLRNIEILEEEANKEEDPVKRYDKYCYLVRENYFMRRYDESLKYLKLVLKESNLMKNMCGIYGYNFANRMYYFILTANIFKSLLNRQEIYNKIIKLFKKEFQEYPGVATIDLLYDMFFNLDEEELIRKLEPCLNASKSKSRAADNFYAKYESQLIGKVAWAYLKRGKYLDAMDTSVRALKHGNDMELSSFQILMDCIRGQQMSDILVFLNSQFDINDTKTLKFLCDSTCVQGFRDVHAYYLDKLVKAGTATKGDQLFLFILFEKYKDAVRIAKQMYDDPTSKTVLQTIFVAAICSDDEELYLENQEILGDYNDVLYSYFEKVPLEDITKEQMAILGHAYPLIALVAGVEKANVLADLYVEKEIEVYMYKTQYYLNNGLYLLAANVEMPDKNDYRSNCLVIKAKMALNQLEEAFHMIKMQLSTGVMDGIILMDLAALAYRAEGQMKIEAKELYERYRTFYDKIIDLQGVIFSDYIADNTYKKKNRALKTMTPAQFRKQLFEDTKNPYIKEISSACLNAANVYENKSMYVLALEALRYALMDADDKSVIYERMANIFEKCENTAIAADLKRM